MKKLFSIIAVLITLNANSQVTKVSLQASGLTCSMCSNAINKALKTVDYVDKVMANIQTSTFNITFKPGANVNFDDLKLKVEDAGFFVAALTANIDFDNAAIVNDEHLKLGGMTFHFLDVKDQVLSGNKTIRILDKGYLTAKEFKKNSKLTKKTCYQTGVAGSEGCCSKEGITVGTRIYHVTI